MLYLKTTIITTLLLTATFLFAQQKYEYAVIDYTPSARAIQISLNGVDFKKVDVPKETAKGFGDANPALIEVTKMEDQGWELFNSTMSVGATYAEHIFVFYLRKKR